MKKKAEAGPGMIFAPFILIAIPILISIFFAFLTYVVYDRLSDEKPLAQVKFEQIEPGYYTLFLAEGDDDDFEEYKIFGDQWRIDAQFVKMRPWANVLGLDAQYNLERLQGRYSNINDENTKPHLAHDLGENDLIDLPQFFLDYNLVMDAEYGSSSYADIDTHRLYTVYRTQSGIIIRSEPLPVEEGMIDKVMNLFD